MRAPLCMLEDVWAAERGEDWKRGKRCGEGKKDGGRRMEGDPTGAGGRKEERRVSESATTRCAADCTSTFC